LEKALDKTKEELLAELDAIYQQLNELEPAVGEKKSILEELKKAEDYIQGHPGYIEMSQEEIDALTLSDLLDIDHLQRIQDAFAKATGIASLISDAETGRPITKYSNFCRVCSLIRQTKEGSKRCMKSGHMLGKQARKLMRPTYHACHSIGFVDASAPIIVAGKHVANWFIGQVNAFGVDQDRVREYSRLIGADENEMLQAFEEMHPMSLERFELILELLWLLAREMSMLGFNNLRLAGDIARQKQARRELAKSYLKLHENLVETVQALALAGEKRDPYTAGHQRRVAGLAKAIAREMDLPDEQVEGLYMAALIHDIGKIKVPAELLTNPGRLTDTEFSLIKCHAEVGFEILKKIKFPYPVAQIVYQHHEKMDGSGYPRKLVGEEILMEARILAVADVTEAITNHRPYRPALLLDKAVEFLKAGRGREFDARAVDACIRLFKEKGYSLDD
jgi:putative nucleotidyltransferase with HDIG domain